MLLFYCEEAGWLWLLTIPWSVTSRSVAKDSPTSAGRRLVRVNSHRITAQLVNGWLSFLDVFCVEDGDKELFKVRVCPACETQLPGNYDITKVDLQPSEEFKSVSD